jgi:hypothetical protein
MATKSYRVLVVHRRPDYEQALIQAGASQADRALIASLSWRLSMERAAQVEFLVVESDGKILDIQASLGAERMPGRFAEGADGRIRLITSFDLPVFAEDLIGTDIPAELLVRNPVRHCKWVLDLATKEVNWTSGDGPNPMI